MVELDTKRNSSSIWKAFWAKYIFLLLDKNKACFLAHVKKIFFQTFRRPSLKTFEINIS